MRPCGDCRLCCKIFPLPVLEKAAGAWCRHAGASGCAIHGPQLPEVCRRYDCSWREHDVLSGAWRPDRIGIVVSEAGSVTVGHRLLPVVVFEVDFPEQPFQDPPCGIGVSPASSSIEVPPVLGGSETVSDASHGDAARKLLDHFVSRGVAVMIIRGLEARIEFDRMRYDGISPGDIEVALRYELSQDAEELKRLGAVSDDFRPLSRDEAEAACRADQSIARSRKEEECER